MEEREQDIRWISGIDKVRRFMDSLRGQQELTQRAVMDRDRRLTGYLRGQTDNVKAPPGFELNNPWRVSFLALLHRACATTPTNSIQTETRIY